LIALVPSKQALFPKCWDEPEKGLPNIWGIPSA
jgi:hypothetical protein